MFMFAALDHCYARAHYQPRATQKSPLPGYIVPSMPSPLSTSLPLRQTATVKLFGAFQKCYKMILSFFLSSVTTLEI